MDTALWRMPFAVRTLRRAAGTDGRVLYVDVVRTIERYRDVPSEVVRDHLHVILHCIFRHLWLRGGRDRTLWGLA